MYVGLRGQGIWNTSSKALDASSYFRIRRRAARLHCYSYSLAITPIITRFAVLTQPKYPTKICSSFGRPWPDFAQAYSTSQTMDRSADARSKRKKSPVNTLERPTKQLKPEISSLVEGDETPSNGLYSSDSEVEPRMLPLAAATADTAEWQATIEKVVRNVVSIHFCQTCSFDTDAASSSEATGFVVDAEKGYILTNRHVVGAGPFWGYCIFDNHEEVSSTEYLALMIQLLTGIPSAMSILYTVTLSTTSEFYDSTQKS